MIPQTPTILYNMAMIPMILVIEVAVSLFEISHHLVGPFEEGFVLDFFGISHHLDAAAISICHLGQVSPSDLTNSYNSL